MFAPLEVADIEAYRRGVERELDLSRAAMAAFRRALGADERAVLVGGADAGHTSMEGAQAAGIPLERYRFVVGVIDSLLRNRRNARAAALTGGRLSASAERVFSRSADRLDSMRVELVVLHSRLAAGAVGPCAKSRRGGPEHPC